MRRYHAHATGVRCPRPSSTAATCTANVGSRHAAVRVAYRASRGELYWTWSVHGSGLRTGSGRVVVPAGSGKPVPTNFARQSQRAYYCPLLDRR